MALFDKPWLVGAKRLEAKLSQKAKKALRDSRTVCKVGYTAPYAVRVHEDLQMRHPRGGQAKFLEEPARKMAKRLHLPIMKRMKAGDDLPTALYFTGLDLAYESSKLVPIDTGLLYRSVYVRLERV